MTKLSFVGFLKKKQGESYVDGLRQATKEIQTKKGYSLDELVTLSQHTVVCPPKSSPVLMLEWN